MQPIKITLGPVRLSFSIGDADKNGALDITVAVRVIGIFEWVFPPVNLDMAMAMAAKDAFEKVANKLAGK